MKNIRVTGDKGFIGSHLIRRLESMGCRVRSLDRTREDLFNIGSLESFVRGADFVVHLAAVNRGSDAQVISGSVVATHNLAKAMMQFAPEARIIYSSSNQVGNGSLYGLAKELCEKMLESYSKDNSLPVSVLRISNVFGEGCKPFYNSVVATFCHLLAEGKELEIKESGREINFVYVGDVVRRIINHLEAQLPSGDSFMFEEVKGEQLLTVTELANLLKSFKNINVESELKTKFEKDLFRTYLSYKK